MVFNWSVYKSSDISTLENEPEEEEEGGVPRPTPHHGLVSGKIKSGGVRGAGGGEEEEVRRRVSVGAGRGPIKCERRGADGGES